MKDSCFDTKILDVASTTIQQETQQNGLNTPPSHNAGDYFLEFCIDTLHFWVIGGSFCFPFAFLDRLGFGTGFAWRQRFYTSF